MSNKATREREIGAGWATLAKQKEHTAAAVDILPRRTEFPITSFDGNGNNLPHITIDRGGKMLIEADPKSGVVNLGDITGKQAIVITRELMERIYEKKCFIVSHNGDLYQVGLPGPYPPYTIRMSNTYSIKIATPQINGGSLTLTISR